MQDHVKGPCVRARYFVCWLPNAWCVVAHARARGLGASVYVVSSTWVVKAWGVRACLVTRRVVLCCVHLCACVRACGGRASGACACVSASGLFHGAGQRVPGDSMCVCGRGRTFFCSAGCLAPGVPSCAWMHECVHLNLLYLLHTFDYDVEGVDECPCWLGPCSAHQRSGRMGTGKLKVSSGRTTQTCPEAWGDEVQMGT